MPKGPKRVRADDSARQQQQARVESSGPRGEDDAPGERPKTAPDNARYDLALYRRRALRFERTSQRFAVAVVAAAFTTAAVGAFTTIADAAILGIVTGVLGATGGALELSRTHLKYDQKAAVYQHAHVELESELDLYDNDAGPYADLGTKGKRREAKRHLTEQLTKINRMATKALD